MAEKAVLMSIHKNWLDKILSGEKILEIRGNYPKSAYLPFQVYLYETRNGGGCGRIRAIALCTNLFRFSKNDLESNEGDAFLKASCLTREQLTPFFSSKNVVYGWQLSDVQPLDMALDAVKTSRPPQGWQYCPIPSNYRHLKRRPCSFDLRHLPFHTKRNILMAGSRVSSPKTGRLLLRNFRISKR